MLTSRQDYERALTYLRVAVHLCRGQRMETMEVSILNSMGLNEAHLGRLDEASLHCGQALERSLALGYTANTAFTLDSLGFIAQLNSDHEAAVEHFKSSVEYFAGFGEIFERANTLTRLGESYTALGRTEDAAAAFAEAERLRDLS